MQKVQSAKLTTLNELNNIYPPLFHLGGPVKSMLCARPLTWGSFYELQGSKN